jgi:nucleoid DNA-binding protein
LAEYDYNFEGGTDMTKAEMVDKLAEKGQMTKRLASESIDLVFSAISDVLVAGDEISLPGFGKFSVIVRQARTGLNPRTQEKLNIPETKVPKFTAAKALKESIK